MKQFEIDEFCQHFFLPSISGIPVVGLYAFNSLPVAKQKNCSLLFGADTVNLTVIGKPNVTLYLIEGLCFRHQTLINICLNVHAIII